MNGILTIHNPTDKCPANSSKFSSRMAILTDKTMNSSVGNKLQDFDDNKEWREFAFCEHPLINAVNNIPPNSMFAVRDNKCPNNSITLGKINVLDSYAINSEKLTNAITETDGSFLQYAWLTPTLCKSQTNINITPNIILPSKSCTLKNWQNYGIFGVLQPQSEIKKSPFIIDDSNKDMNVDGNNTLLNGYFIVQPQLCFGLPNDTITKCKNKHMQPMRTAMECDEEMKILCGRKEFKSDPLCSCFYSNTQTLSNPGCIDQMCNVEGYKTEGTLTTPCNISNVPIDCNRYNQIKNDNTDVKLIRNEWTDYCFIEEKIKDTKLLPLQITERSTGKDWFSNPRIYIFLILFITFLSVIFLYVI